MTFVIDARTASDHFPGIGRYVANLTQAIARQMPDFPATLLVDPAAQTTRLELPPLPRVGCPASPFTLRQQWVIPRELRHMHARLYHSPYYLMPYRPGVPAVFTCHDLIPLVYPEFFTGRQRLIYRLAHLLAIRASRAIIAVSAATRRDLAQHFRVPLDRITLIPEAADPHFRPQAPQAVAIVKQKYHLPDRYLLYFASNKPHKNLVRLVTAYALAQKQGEMPPLVIAGHWDPRFPQARHKVLDLNLADHVYFTGSIAEPDLPGLYAGADLFILPSLYEGFGLPVLEAMACGVPVICANTSSLPEIAGDAAMLVDPLDPAQITAAMRQVLSDTDLQAHLRARGLEKAASFSWESAARQTVLLYRSLAG
ncbi:MAG: glycosyltransferase family 4 protein [Chloroflexi bacterium]|nr:glycosyltransferase family 4 protein [Chloroflexota bacterium]